MMKATKFIFIALAAFAASALTSCGSKTVISGTWEGGQGDTLVLCEKVPEADSIFIASAVVGEDGSFSFAVAPEYPKRLTLWFGGKSKDIFVGKDPIGVTITKREGTNRKGEAYSTFDCAVDGGRDQKILEDGAEFTLSNAFIQLGTMIMASKMSEMTDEKQIDSISRGIVMMKEAYDSVIRVYLDTTRNSVAVTYFFDDFLLKSRPFEFARDWYDSLDASVKGSVQGRNLAQKIEVASKFSVGGKPDDFTLPDPDGKDFSLSQLRGHYTIIDFWASWCGPCLAEAPNVKAIYEKHHKDGLEILGVSLDEEKSRDKWVAAIKDHGLDWHQVSSLKGWDCPVAKSFNVTGIPRMFILDPDGKIIAQDLRGEELAAKIDEIYAK